MKAVVALVAEARRQSRGETVARATPEQGGQTLKDQVMLSCASMT